MRFLILLVAGGSVFLAEARAGEEPAKKSPTLITTSYVSQGWLVQETDSFRVVCRSNLPEARRLPEACEALRRQLQETWFGDAEANWPARCEVVVHPTVTEYVRQLGPASRQSSGCATIDVDRGTVLKRRVDLRADAADWLNTALPHEMTHVVLADKFTQRQIPRWADEGMAILAEPAGRQAVRRQAMQKSMSQIRRYSAAELLALADYPVAERRDAFYGQSASLVAYLIERDSPARFLEFLQLGQKRGFDQALAEVYSIKSSADLDVRWRPQLLDRGQSAELFAARIARITSGKPQLD